MQIELCVVGGKGGGKRKVHHSFTQFTSGLHVTIYFTVYHKHFWPQQCDSVADEKCKCVTEKKQSNSIYREKGRKKKNGDKKMTTW